MDCLPFAARLPLWAWLDRKKSSSLRSGIFSCQALRKKAIQEAGGLRYAPVFFPARPCAKRQSKRPEAYKIGKTHPDGIIQRIMELQIIESISKHAVTLVLVIGILMLTDKGIMPTGMIAMLLLTGGIIGFLFRALLLIVRIAFIFFIVGLLFF